MRTSSKINVLCCSNLIQPVLECVCLDFTAVICNYYTLFSLAVFSLAKSLQTSYLLADI